MSEREIKPGSVWRNIHGEVTATPTPTGGVRFKLPGGSDANEWSEFAFRATHEWVRDPVELPNVGSWWRTKESGPMKAGFPTVVSRVAEPSPIGFVEVVFIGHRREWRLDDFYAVNEPCDPPPLVAALDALTDCGYDWSLDGKVMPVIREWRRIKESIK